MKRAVRQDPHLIVGAGAKGLTLALALARRGEPVLVAESSRAIGGQARSFRYGRFTFDLGLHAFVSADRGLRTLVKELLGQDYREFTARAASRLPDGAMVEDSANWCSGGSFRRFHDLLPGADAGWNCMRVSKPPSVIYPRRGGFGRLLEELARAVKNAGGRILLDAPVARKDLRLENGRITDARVRGAWIRVRSCHWASGAPTPTRKSSPRSALLLTHFMVRGRAPVPYHWVRLFDVATPFTPQLAYYPARFASANAPKGHYGVGAVVPLALAAQHSREDAKLHRWILKDPRILLPAVTGGLARAGLLDADAVMDVRQELLPTSGSPSGA